MRTFLTIASSTLIVAATAMLVWRPALGFALALIGFCVNLARLKRQAKANRAAATAAHNRLAPAIPEVKPRRAVPRSAPVTETPANDHAPMPAAQETAPDAVESVAFPADLLERVTAAGWQASARGATLFCARAGARLALLQAGPNGATTEDLAAAARLKTRYNTDYVGIVSPERPDATLTAQGLELGVQFVNTARVEAYLAMASSFKPDAGADRRVTA